MLTSKSAANKSSDSVNMSGADGFFGLAPATKKTTKGRRCERLSLCWVVQQEICNMCLSHILCRAQNMLQGAETTRLWITSQQLNATEHMTERHKIKNPCITQPGSDLGILHTHTTAFGLSEHSFLLHKRVCFQFLLNNYQRNERGSVVHFLMMEFIQLALYANTNRGGQTHGGRRGRYRLSPGR